MKADEFYQIVSENRKAIENCPEYSRPRLYKQLENEIQKYEARHKELDKLTIIVKGIGQKIRVAEFVHNVKGEMN